MRAYFSLNKLQQRKNLRLQCRAVAIISAATLLSSSVASVAYNQPRHVPEAYLLMERHLAPTTIATSEPIPRKQSDLAVGLAVEQTSFVSARLQGHTAEVISVAFSPDGATLASASRDQSVRLWDVKTRQSLGHPLTGHTDWVFSVAFSPDGTTLASASIDATVRLWDVKTRQPLGSPLMGHTEGVVSVAFSPDGTMLASAGRDQSVRLWDARTRQPLGSPLIGHTE
jgi:WD40 repeat protein